MHPRRGSAVLLHTKFPPSHNPHSCVRMEIGMWSSHLKCSARHLGSLGCPAQSHCCHGKSDTNIRSRSQASNKLQVPLASQIRRRIQRPIHRCRYSAAGCPVVYGHLQLQARTGFARGLCAGSPPWSAEPQQYCVPACPFPLGRCLSSHQPHRTLVRTALERIGYRACLNCYRGQLARLRTASTQPPLAPHANQLRPALSFPEDTLGIRRLGLLCWNTAQRCSACRACWNCYRGQLDQLHTPHKPRQRQELL